MRSYVNLLAVALAAPMVSGALSAPIYHRYGNQLVEFKGWAVDKGNLRGEREGEAYLTPSDLVALRATRLPTTPTPTPPGPGLVPITPGWRSPTEFRLRYGLPEPGGWFLGPDRGTRGG